MSAGDFINAVERFFLDFIGTVLPGMTLLFGCCYVWRITPIQIAQGVVGTVDNAWIVLVVFGYVAGHAVTSFGFQIVTKWADFLASRRYIAPLIPFAVSEQKIYAKLLQDPIFLAFKAAVVSQMPSMRQMATSENTPLRVWRNLAIALIQSEGQLIYRFTFISLLNLGVASALLLVFLIWLFSAAVTPLNLGIHGRELNPYALLLPAAALLFFLERFYQFNRRTLQVPFAMALVKIENEGVKARRAKVEAADDSGGPSGGLSLVVYLAGGFKSGWQDVVKAKIQTVRYFDPRLHGLAKGQEFTAWDLQAVRHCDCVFAFLEASNPGGYALAFELGFARALGKFVIFVDDKSQRDPEIARYLEMLSEASDVVFSSLDEGIRFLDSYRTAV